MVKRNSYQQKKDGRRAYKIWVQNGGDVVVEKARTDAQLESDALRSRRATMAREARRVEAARSLEAAERHAARLVITPDYRGAVESMRARIAELCGPLMPLGRRGWTA